MSNSNHSKPGTTAAEKVPQPSEKAMARMQELKRQVYVSEAQLEGLFRDMYAGCTQKNFSNSIGVRTMQMEEINSLFNSILRDVNEYLQIQNLTGMDENPGLVN